MKAAFDRVMERRSAGIAEQIGAWLPAAGAVLDVGSGTGHLAAYLERKLGLHVETADVTDMHVTGRAPCIISDGALPFDDRRFAAALLVFMLHYPAEPAMLLSEAARTTRGPVIVMQSLYSGRLGYCWLRAREFMWTFVAFHISRLIGYVPPSATFTMSARRFYTVRQLEADVKTAGLRVRFRREQTVLPAGALIVAAWLLEPDV